MPYLGGARVHVIDCPAACKNLDTCAITSGLRYLCECQIEPLRRYQTRCMNLQANILRGLVPLPG